MSRRLGMTTVTNERAVASEPRSTDRICAVSFDLICS